MFGELRKYRVVVVTGCQRSGTTLVAHAIAHDTRHCYIDEEDYGTKNISAWRDLIETGKEIVIQCPAMSRWVQEIHSKDVLVVWVYRSVQEIDRSIERVGWSAESEVAKYVDLDIPKEHRNHIVFIKNYYWHNFQKKHVGRWMEVNYRDMVRHPLWVDDKERKDFSIRQWKK